MGLLIVNRQVSKQYRNDAMIQSQHQPDIYLLPLKDGSIKRLNLPLCLSNGITVERKVQESLLRVVGGKKEVYTESGAIDILTDTELIEIKATHCWKNAIGQLMVFSYYYPRHRLRLHLFGECHPSYLAVIMQHCDRFCIRLTWEIEP